MERITRAKAIRLKCLDCSCGSANEVRLCPVTECPLYRYRLGKEIVDEQTPKGLRRTFKKHTTGIVSEQRKEESNAEEI